MNTCDIFLRTTMLLVLCGPAIGQAADSQDSLWTRDKLFGDWGGLRSGLGEHGVAFDLRLSQFYQNVADGGIVENDEYGGKVDYIVNVDGEKLGLWKGLFLNLHAETQYGDSVVAEAGPFALPNSAMLYPAPEDDTTEITGWSVTQGVYQKNDTIIALTAGKINVVDFVNEAWPFMELKYNGFLNLNVSFPLAPFSRYLQLSHLGAGALMLNKGRIQAAAVVLDTHNASNTSGFNKLGDNGLIALGLYRFFLNIQDKPGQLTFLVGTSTGEYAILEDTVWVPTFFFTGPRARRTLVFNLPGLDQVKERYPWTVSAMYDQILWQADSTGKRNIRFFTSGAIADDDPSFSDWSVLGQLIATGLFESRPLDKMGIGGFYTGLTSRVKDLASSSPLIPALDDFAGIELFYSAAITPSVHLTGDIQITDHMLSSEDAAIIPGVRLVIDF